MGFSQWDKILIKNLHDWKGYWGYGAKKLSKEFPLRSWSKRELSCNVMSTRDKSIVWMNWNGSSLMSGAGSNSWFFDEATDQWRGRLSASVLKEELVNWQCWILSVSVTFSVNCLTAASLIHSCSFYKVVQQQIWDLVVYLGYYWSQLISVCNSEKIIKIGQCLPKLCSDEKGSSFFMTHSGVPVVFGIC